MKTNFKALSKRIVAMVILVTMLLCFNTFGYAAQEDWNKWQKVNYLPANGDQTYEGSSWTNYLIELYQAIWYQNPTFPVSKGDFSLAQLRTVQASLERRGLSKLSAENEILDFKDTDTLTVAAQEEIKILKSLGILTGTPEGYMKLDDPIRRCEAAKVLAIMNSQVLKIPSIRSPKQFTDTIGHWAEKNISVAYQMNLLVGVDETTYMPNENITLEQTLKILENEIGYFGITRADVAKAMSETFKITLNTDLSNSIISPTSYVKYEEKMKTYGFDKVYDNGSAKSDESVTMMEVVKLALSVTLNLGNVESHYLRDPLKRGINWVAFSNAYKLVTEDMKIEDYNDKAKYINVISYFQNCKTSFLHDQPIKDEKVSLMDMDKYSLEQQTAIKDMVANRIIYLLADKLNGDEYIFKGQLNELVVNFAEQYNTIVSKGNKINTDPDKMPSNAYLYPYILSNVDISTYEKPLFVDYNKNKWSPKEFYDVYKGYYNQIEERCQQYADTLINIDYETITREDFKQKLLKFSDMAPNDYSLDKYIPYVLENEIVIKGSSKVQLPIIYDDGVNCRVRVRLQFDIINSKTQDNLLYLDLMGGQKSIYLNKSYDIYVDFYITKLVYGSDDFYMEEKSRFRAVLDREEIGIILEDYQ